MKYRLPQRLAFPWLLCQTAWGPICSGSFPRKVELACLGAIQAKPDVQYLARVEKLRTDCG